MNKLVFLNRMISEEIAEGRRIAIYPMGKWGETAKRVLVNKYHKKGIYIDNEKYKYISDVISFEEFAESANSEDICVLICTDNETLEVSFRKELSKQDFRYKSLLNPPTVEMENLNARLSLVDTEHLPYPSWIEIETINRCNGHCSFCPVNADEPQRHYAKMEEELFYKIIDELEKRHYQSGAALYSNNEPFLDERIIEFQKYAKEHVPNAQWILFTNGSLLSVEKLETILPYLDKLIIDAYSENGEYLTVVENIIAYIDANEEYKRKIEIRRVDRKAVLFSRGGQAPNKKTGKFLYDVYASCLQPFHSFIIRPDGKVSLCCNDALGTYTLGDINKSSIEEIWYSEDYMRIRKLLLEKGRNAFKLCDSCDAFYV